MGLVGDLLGNAALPHDATTCGGLLLGTFERFQRRVLLLPIDQVTMHSLSLGSNLAITTDSSPAHKRQPTVDPGAIDLGHIALSP